MNGTTIRNLLWLEREFNIIDFSKYGLVKKETRNVPLIDIHMQYGPNSRMLYQFCTKNGYLDTRMINSPHYEIADLYFKNGKEWLINNYKSTTYYKMCCDFLNHKDLSIDKFINLCDSIKNGYLIGKYEKEYPVILEKPFALTRYNRKVPFDGYETFSGHHRIGILLAIGIENAVVIIAEDGDPGSCFTNGKIHDLCVGIDR